MGMAKYTSIMEIFTKVKLYFFFLKCEFFFKKKLYLTKVISLNISNIVNLIIFWNFFKKILIMINCFKEIYIIISYYFKQILLVALNNLLILDHICFKIKNII